MAVKTAAEQKAYEDQIMAEWNKAKAKEAATPSQADPAAVQQWQQGAEKFKQDNWYNGGTTATPSTGAQNLNNVLNQAGNTAGPSDNIQAIRNQAAQDSAGQQTFHIASAAPTAAVDATPMKQAMASYVPPAATGLTFDQAKGQVSGQIDPMFQRALEALQAQKYQDQLNGDQLGMARGGSHSGLAADLQNKVAIAASGKAADMDATRQTQIAQMAQDLVNRGQDNDFRNKQQALAEYLGINQLDLQKAGVTGQYNGQNTMQQNQINFGNGMDLGALLGNYNGPTNNQGQTQGFNSQSEQVTTGQWNPQTQNGNGGIGAGIQTLASKQFGLQQQGQEFNQNMANKQFDYQKVQDDIKNNQWSTQTENQMKQWAEGNKLNWAQFDQSTKQALAQIAISQQNANTNSYSAQTSRQNMNNDNTLQREKFDWEKTQGTQNAALSKELDGLYTGITSGQITGSAAIDEINNKVKIGLIKPAEAAQMLSLINSVTSSQPNVRPALTQQQIDSNGGNNPQDLNSAQLEKLWNADPTGKSAGRPIIDWGEWYTDPRGKVGGISYEAWKQAYGPQLKAR